MENSDEDLYFILEYFHHARNNNSDLNLKVIKNKRRLNEFNMKNYNK